MRRRCIYLMPLARFYMVGISTAVGWRSVGAERSSLETFRRDLSEDVRTVGQRRPLIGRAIDLGRFSMVDVSTAVGRSSVGAKKALSLETFQRELSEDVRTVGQRHPLGCRAIDLGNPPPQGCAVYILCTYTVVNGTVVVCRVLFP